MHTLHRGDSLDFLTKNGYVILPKDLNKGYRGNEKKPVTDLKFYKWREEYFSVLSGRELLHEILKVLMSCEMR